MPLPPAAEIRWGTGYDNALSFNYPAALDAQVAWRQPAPGARETRNPAGVSDAWIMAYDYMLAGRARWFRKDLWGGVGLQDFLDWAGQKNTFRFIPDDRYPSFYVDNCYLEAPFADSRPQLEEADGSQAIDVVIRQQAFDFNWATRGLMFEYAPGKNLTDPVTIAFTRASTANRISRDGVLSSEAVDALRDRHFLNGIRTTLLELGSTNLCLQAENFGTTWSAVGTPTRSAAAHTLSGVTLDLIGDDDGASIEYYSQNIGFTGNAAKAVSLYVKKGTSPAAGGSLIALVDTTASADRLAATLTWSGTTPSVAMATGTYLGYETMADGVYRLLFVTTSVTAANTNQIRIEPAATLAQIGNLYAGGVQAEDNAFPTSYKKTTTGSVARSADSFSAPHAFIPQALTLYAKLTECGTILSTNGRVLQIGKSDNTAPMLLVFVSGGFYRAHHETAAGNVTSTLAAVGARNDTVELLLTLTALGEVTISQSVNGGAATTASTSAALALATAWSDTKFWLNSVGATAPGANGFQFVRAAPGVRTLAEMRAA